MIRRVASNKGDTDKTRRPKAKGRRTGFGSLSALQKQLRGRNRELAESRRQLAEVLEQQTATSKVLEIISASPGDLEPVFNAILTNATHICEATFGNLFLREGSVFRSVAVHSHQGHVDSWRRDPIFDLRDNPGVPLDRVGGAKQVVHISDLRKDSSYIEKNRRIVTLVEVTGARTYLCVPMLKEWDVIGAISIFRGEVRPFTEKQIELVKNFAAQAVIAIENARLLNELRESLEQQTATADVLKVISRSAFDLQPVLDTLVESAARLCRADRTTIRLLRNGLYYHLASHGHSLEHQQRMLREPVRPDEGLMVGRVVGKCKPVHVIDAQSDANPAMANRSRSGNVHTMLGVPLLRQGTPIGVLLLQRSIVQPFTDKQIELATTFADQAVIAIENVRLFEAEQQRTRELSESLEQQTATSEVLRIISSSPGELESIFQTLLQNAVRVCGAQFGNLALYDGRAMRMAAMHNAPPVFEELRRRDPMIPPGASVMWRVVDTKDVAQIADLTAEEPHASSALVQLAGARTAVGVPMIKDGELVGGIVIYRTEPRPFVQKQIELLANFAAQAVIAIENARLLNELRQRTGELTESLEQQTATSEVLKVIASSTGELEPVFSAMLANATRICEAKFGLLFRFDGERFHFAAETGTPRAFADFLRQRGAFQPAKGTHLDRVMRTKQVSHTVDYAAENVDAPPVKLGGARSTVDVPMLKDDELVGAFSIYRVSVRPFSEKQIALLANFAAQAVIAIENARLLNELRESLEQQTATSEVLKVISSSPGELQHVFEAMLENATRICCATFGSLVIHDGMHFRRVAAHNAPPALLEDWKRTDIIDLTKSAVLGPMLRLKRVFHIADLGEEHPTDPLHVLAGARTFLGVPMLKDEQLIGVIGIYRREIRPFTDKQIELLQNFAAQAVIAIENARLLNELRQRTEDLSEALEQQTATSEVLKIISSSRGELDPVFDTMVENAVRLCQAEFGNLFLYNGQDFVSAAVHSASKAYAAARRRGTVVRHSHPDVPLNRLSRTKAMIHIADLRTERSYIDGDLSQLVDVAGARTFLVVPMLKENELIGALVIYRLEVRPFNHKQIELIQNFAAQAVIAIENARLLNELRQRTEDLSESLEQQTATSEVLSIISSSPGNVEPVFGSMLQNAVRLCEADHGVIFRYAEDVFSPVAVRASPDLAEFLSRRGPFKPPHGTSLDRLLQTRDVVTRLDEATETYPSSPSRIGGARSLMAVPLLKDQLLIGAIVLYREEVRAFNEKQIKLITNFAAQAVIAIENSRLLNELRESLQQQTATADVLKVISRSTFDLQTVLNTLVESAARLCDADSAAIHRPHGDAYPYVASFGLSPEYDGYMRERPIIPGRGTVLGRAVTEGRPVQLPDVRADPEYTHSEGQKLGGFRTVLGVPLMREGTPIGVIILARNTVRPFSDKQIELASTFADQAAIAIENVRLFDEIQDKSRQVEEASKHKSQFLANMSHELRTPLNAILGYTELIVDGVYGETPQRVQDTLKRIQTNGKHLLGLINDVLDLSKIEAGQLTLSLSDYTMRDVIYAVYGAVEGLAAEKKLKLRAEIAPDMPTAHGDERRITQVLLNLVGNAIKFSDEGEVTIKASAADGRFAVSVVDTGPGISEDDQKKLFQEFQQADSSTTKKKGGTGLGLAISKRIIEMHGGTVKLESKLGEGSTFWFTLPVRSEQVARHI